MRAENVCSIIGCSPSCKFSRPADVDLCCKQPRRNCCRNYWVLKVHSVTLKLLPPSGLKCADSLRGPCCTPTGLCAAVTSWCVPSATESWSQTTSYTSHTLASRAASVSPPPSSPPSPPPSYKWRPRIIQLDFVFELGMTSVADFKKCLLVL